MTALECVPSVADEVAAGDDLGTVEYARERHLHVSAILRWIQIGLPAGDGTRVRLEAVRVGKKWRTSRAAVRRFFGKLPTNSTPEPRLTKSTTSRTADRRDRERAAAAEKLKERGF